MPCKMKQISLLLLLLLVPQGMHAEELSYSRFASVPSTSIYAATTKSLIQKVSKEFSDCITIYSENGLVTHTDIYLPDGKERKSSEKIRWDLPFKATDTMEGIVAKLGPPDSRFVKYQDGSYTYDNIIKPSSLHIYFKNGKIYAVHFRPKRN